MIWSCRKTYGRLNWTCSWGALAIGIAIGIVWVAMFPDALARNAAWPAALQSVPSSWAAAWLALRLVGYVVAAPMAEELAFRVYAMRRVMDSDIEAVPIGAFSWPSFLISSAALVALTVLLRFWQPRQIWRFPDETAHEEPVQPTRRPMLVAS